MLEEATLSVSSLSPASLSRTAGSVVGRELLVCSLANVVLGVGIMATLNVSRAAGAGSGAAGSGCGGCGSSAAGSGGQRLAAVRPGLASAGAAARHSGGSVAVSPPWASRAGPLGAGGQAAAPWAGAAAQGLAWQPGSVALSLSVAAGPGQAGSEGSVGRRPATGASLRADGACLCRHMCPPSASPSPQGWGAQGGRTGPWP